MMRMVPMITYSFWLTQPCLRFPPEAVGGGRKEDVLTGRYIFVI